MVVACHLPIQYNALSASDAFVMFVLASFCLCRLELEMLCGMRSRSTAAAAGLALAIHDNSSCWWLWHISAVQHAHLGCCST
jgi:hypothetical protein